MNPAGVAVCLLLVSFDGLKATAPDPAINALLKEVHHTVDLAGCARGYRTAGQGISDKGIPFSQGAAHEAKSEPHLAERNEDRDWDLKIGPWLPLADVSLRQMEYQ